VIYLSGRHHLPPELPRNRAGNRVVLAPGDARVIVALLVLLALTSTFWIVQAQVWNIYPLWLRDVVDRDLSLGFTIPVTWFQSLDALAVLLLAPFTVLFWRWQSKRNAEPADLVKIALGCGFFGLSCVMLSVGQALAVDGRVLVIWPVLFHFVVAIGYLYAAPIALSLVSRAAPAAVNAMLVGSYYLGIFIGGIVSGWLGRFYESLHPSVFWLLHAAIGIGGGVLILLSKRRFVRELRLT
jgi:POT family proton-dependent oligopeptide transporter